MIKRVLLILIVFTTVTLAQETACEKIASYRMNVELDVAAKTITGTQELQWRNNSPLAVKEIFFHAYLNAFKNNRSTFLQQAGAEPAWGNFFGPDWPQDGWGYLEIDALEATQVNKFNKTSILPTFKYVQPDDQNPHDQTVFRVELPTPVNPGEALVFNIHFTAKLPFKGIRAGFVDDLFFAGQWFPKIGVLQENGWNCHQYHRNSEFFADFGDYDVSITVPENYIIGATGILQDSTISDGKITRRFVQSCVHDFAWTASPDFKVITRTFKHANLPEVKIRLLYLPENEQNVSGYLEGTEAALQHFGTWYTPYPYPQLTVVDVPGDSRLGSMEYPTLFTVKIDYNSIPGLRAPAWTAIHECGHQFWYGLVANNEFEEAWLDEALVVYSTIRCMNAVYGDLQSGKTYLEHGNFSVPFTLRKVKMNTAFRAMESYRPWAQWDVMDNDSWAFLNNKSYRAQQYYKGALMLFTLENILGEEVMSRIMSSFANRFTFKHPTTADFINTVNEFASQPMNRFFEQALHSTAVVDYAVKSITSEPETGLYGLDEQGNYIAPVEKEKNPQRFNSKVIVERAGDYVIPVDVQINFANGETSKEVWDGEGKWKKYTFSGKAAVLSVIIDPERKLALDVNYTNNTLYAEAKPFAARRWATTWLFWLQHLLELAAFFA
ncbi:MAG TPA: M1 family metallopeptidase [bacterium]|nr:M1 family metallopeptidase [bacterium]